MSSAMAINSYTWKKLENRNIAILKNTLLVIPSAEIACILQQADTILIASWSTTSTLHSIDLSDSFFSDLITVSIIPTNKTSRNNEEQFPFEACEYHGKDSKILTLINQTFESHFKVSLSTAFLYFKKTVKRKPIEK